MTWTNAFDLGECTVSVNSFYSSEFHVIFSQVMAKGDSQTFTDSGLAMTYTIAVSSDGVVTLTGDQFGGSGGDISVVVAPAGAPTGVYRVSGITVDVGTFGSTNVVAAGNFNDGPFPALSGSGSTWTPDPCEFTPYSGAPSYCMAIEATAVSA